jgi:hypothetical protein
MEAFCEARANKRRERDIHVRIKEIHTHMRETKMKKEEEELKQHEKSSQKAGGTIEDTRGTIEKVQKRNVLRHLLHAVGSTVSVVIPIITCCNSNLFYVSYFNFYGFFLSNSLSAQQILKWLNLEW